MSNGREAEAALGLRNNWHLAEGLVANTTVESIRTLNGATNNTLALTGALEYTAHENWKTSARLEWRGNSNTNGILGTMGFAARITDSWTFLGRDVLSTTTTKGSTGGTHFQDRLQFGFALRDTSRNRWNALSLFELKSDNDQRPERIRRRAPAIPRPSRSPKPEAKRKIAAASSRFPTPIATRSCRSRPRPAT